ncbi:MAG: TraR/DksA C4-type zinc finger protein [Patescibacteria group bacterium]
MALAKIDAGNYGLCEISQEPIELDRLEANPSARTCKKHLDQI